ncbi:hypothetical protein [Lentilactobacillus sp. Marseille-Q4993]|uniref:hypothetical protein n=1 Tax=Lentilactobacillus sp. Marseille-Q4993 TaxID=3039492 RepID=UPI0024BC84B9|nr:hypothetical protein [Lentilactobacillus sp. Marseille-Q4993]
MEKAKQKGIWISAAAILLLCLLNFGITINRLTPSNHSLTRIANQHHQKLNNHWTVTKVDREGDLILMGTTKTRLIVQFLQKNAFYYRALVTRTYLLNTLRYRTTYDLMPIKRANYFVYGKLNRNRAVPTINHRPTSSLAVGKAQIWYGLESHKLNQTLRFR